MSEQKYHLIVIDVQKGFDGPKWGKRNNPQAEENIARLINKWREKGQEVIHVHHYSLEENSPLREDRPGHKVKDEALPLEDEKVFIKHLNSAFIGTNLEKYLKEKSYSKLIICGLTTDHCISTTVRMAGNLGFEVILISDACATFDRTGPEGVYHRAEEIHQIHLASLNDEFCSVLSTNVVLSR